MQSSRLVFDEQAYQWLWDESLLSQLDWLFQIDPPGHTMFGEQVAEIHRRTEQVRRVNDLFFVVVNNDTSIEEVENAIVALAQPSPSLLDYLRSFSCLSCLEDIRKTVSSPSEKVVAFLDLFGKETDLDLLSQESVKGCLEALQGWKYPGKVKALLVKSNGEGALTIPLQIKVQPGSGQVRDLVQDREDFKKALERARLALTGQGFLRASDDVLCTLVLTEPQYVGDSISLAAAVGMDGAARGVVIDPYTAFTGNINWDGEHWRVLGVSGIPQKLEAARLNGCRRVFIPRQNLQEAGSPERTTLQVIPVDNLLEVFLQLRTSFQPLPGDSLQVRKINTLQTFCQAQGWSLSLPRSIQNGLQFHIVPPLLQGLVINIYDTGTHTPRQHDHHEYQEVLNALQGLEESPILIQKIEQRFNIQDLPLRTEIQTALEKLQPTGQRQEPHCEYSFRFDQGQEHLVVKQYQKGSLQIQGTAGKLYKTILECILPRYNLHYPNARLSIEALLGTKEVSDPDAASSPLS